MADKANEQQMRARLIEVGKSWLGTPYRNTGCLKGAGTNCAMLMWAIAREAGAIPADTPEPRWYSPQLHAHSREERLISNVLGCGCHEIREDQVQPGDVVAYLTGLSHGHLALIVDWPHRVIQSSAPRGCQYSHGKGGRVAGCRMKFFTLFPPLENGDHG